jgi:ATP-dependent Lon protease
MIKLFTEAFPVLPLRDLVVFPGMVVPLFVGREKSMKALEASTKTGNKILLIAQKESGNDDPTPAELYKVGVVGQILQILKLNDSTIKILIEGGSRVKVTKYFLENSFYHAKVKACKDDLEGDPKEIVAIRRSILGLFDSYVQLNSKLNPETASTISGIEDVRKFADAISAQVLLRVKDKQGILEANNIVKRLERILALLQVEIEILNTETRIKTRVRHQIEKKQKDYYLNEQLDAIHKELGEADSKDETADISKKLKSLKLTKEVREKAESEVKKLKMMNPMSTESAVIRNYLDWIVSLPWENYSKLNTNLKKAEDVLEKDHYGLEKVKERILEYLAVNLRTNKLKSPIICLIGPPGVGKTSLVRSIASATGREFVKISLGGLRDEAEIKGHRRTYIGALPGKLIQVMKKAKESNPVILLDEIDKLGMDYRGDPASALLEILDPEQNHAFNDHYIEADYNLSNVMFIATANSYEGIPRPLLDRMEVIRISGYTEEEKIAIAENYLIKKQLEMHGAKKDEISIKRSAIVEIIRYYTREAGVRSLDRNIAKLARKAIKDIMINETSGIIVDDSNVGNFLGVKKFNFGQVEEHNLIGITNGLAYTEVGGDLLSIEVLLLYGKGGDVKITGKLGDVMKESVQAALSYIRSRATDYGIKPSVFKNKDIHLHVPEGATPKDGPSAGIAISTSLVSALTGIPVRNDVAMTGEITLRGRVLPIGGLKEKLLAALRGGVKTVIIPQENLKDLEEIPNNVKTGLKIISVENVDEVFKIALTESFVPITWDEEKEMELEKNKNNRNEISISGLMPN